MNRYWRKSHRILGIVLLLPLIVWAMRGMIFLGASGWGDAYTPVRIKTMPLEDVPLPDLPFEIYEWRALKTSIGVHLLVKTEQEWRHYSAADGQAWPEPSAQEVRQLLTEAIAANPNRFGKLTEINGLQAATDTDCSITLNWNTLSVMQECPDHARINLLYQLHYLRWTGWRPFDTFMGYAALIACATRAFRNSPRSGRRFYWSSPE